jgi:cytochrome c oxidase cbb3-type subunit 3
MCLRCRNALVLALAFALALAAGALAGCERETRRFREIPPTVTARGALRVGELQPGGAPPPGAETRSAYEGNAYAVSEGKRFFSYYNCSGCHANGGGAIGPPLMDDLWIYGGEPQNIYASIVEGRPNGMPGYGGKISNQQVWQLVAYVRSLSGLLRADVAPGRSDDMYAKPQEQSTERAQPKQAAEPPQSDQP